jgi:hypothetical protein
MDRELESLGMRGLGDHPGSSLQAAISALSRATAESGDARYSIAGEALRELDSWWTEHDEAGGVPRRLLEDIDNVIKSRLPVILEAPDAKSGTDLALQFRALIREHLLSPRDWIRLGLASA